MIAGLIRHFLFIQETSVAACVRLEATDNNMLKFKFKVQLARGGAEVWVTGLTIWTLRKNDGEELIYIFSAHEKTCVILNARFFGV